jgi:hypothetical protein
MSAGPTVGTTVPPFSMPIPMGVIAETGETHEPWDPGDGSGLKKPLPIEKARAKKPDEEKVLAVHADVTDPKDLKQTGWGVLFASDVDPAIKAALQPLLDLRSSQVNNDALFKIFEGPEGVKPKQPVAAWAASRGVALDAPVDPTSGVPFYLMIVGSLDRIPYEFQAQLDLQWAVGRLHFDKLEDYASYAQKVCEYETGKAPAQTKRAALWMPRNPLDMATPLLAGTMATNFLGQAEGSKPLGSAQGFKLTSFVGEGQATKQRLGGIFRGSIDGGTPSLIFTGSHGAEWPMSDPEKQQALQGALVTQEWTRGQPLEPDNYFAATDLPDDTKVHGTMVFLFACFGSGCPAQDSYYRASDGSPRALAPAPLVAKLPQALLSRGALAVIGHVDRAFSYAFENGQGTPQPQVLRDPLTYLMQGKPVGMATDPLNLLWSTLAARMGILLGSSSGGTVSAPSPALANMVIARDDARNYMILGDPAVRLRTEAMS